MRKSKKQEKTVLLCTEFIWVIKIFFINRLMVLIRVIRVRIRITAEGGGSVWFGLEQRRLRVFHAPQFSVGEPAVRIN